MPYDILKVDGKYRVIKQGEERNIGTHDTRKEAEAQMRAILHDEGPPTKPTPGTQAGSGMRLNDSYEPEPIAKVFVDGRVINTGR